ncbi:N-acetylglucosamine-6-O-sulfatase [Porphyromonas levii]|nr:N-acetylglucosamine-6-O-sulfatase [Porphyromonas levii]MBR8714338.1 N-acetylglucosamine-6-O-sulfatase [Porphyromonas levii]MBR8726879.1 N-acetylglucosamine-6-O-sulfatase [Porphyromonas levii]MBR8728729.1 N-acetylglucosamine-6-O-sulfatase [Porphyromonas levii]MBR8730896.1 N-acetylglucosamine-6-O-sulfatase [Porphyromonas levii]
MAMRHYGVRTDRCKLMHFYHDRDFWELYDLEKDPHELVNEYDNPEYARVNGELMTQLIKLQTQYGDTTALRLNAKRLEE